MTLAQIAEKHGASTETISSNLRKWERVKEGRIRLPNLARPGVNWMWDAIHYPDENAA